MPIVRLYDIGVRKALKLAMPSVPTLALLPLPFKGLHTCAHQGLRLPLGPGYLFLVQLCDQDACESVLGLGVV